MKTSEVRDWATAKFGSHSHQEGQVLAALGPIEEWLGHLARYGVNFELVPAEEAAKLQERGGAQLKPLHPKGEPPAMVNSGAIGWGGDESPQGPLGPDLIDPVEPLEPVGAVEVPILDPAGFVGGGAEGVDFAPGTVPGPAPAPNVPFNPTTEEPRK